MEVKDHIWILITNGGVGLILALALIKAFGKILGRFLDSIVKAVSDTGKAQVDELRELRNDIKVSTATQALGMTNLTDRVSRVEGKIEGIAFAVNPRMTDAEEHTPVIGTPVHGFGENEPTPVHVIRDGRRGKAQNEASRSTPAKGVPSTGYAYQRPKTKGDR